VWSCVLVPNFPRFTRLPSGFTWKEFTLLVNWLLWNSKLLSGLYKTRLELLPDEVNGVPGTGVRTPKVGLAGALSIVQASASAGLPVASPAYRRSAAQLKSKPERLPEPVLAKGEPETWVNTPELMVNIETLV